MAQQPELFKTHDHKFTLPEMLDAARKEVRMREAVYPRRVAADQMKHSAAVWGIGAMKAIVALLEEEMRKRGA